MEQILFDNTDSLLRILASVPVLYLAVIGFVRVSGKRSTSQMNNFDWIVTVAMGSLVGSGIILEDVKLVEVCFAISLLLGSQYIVTTGVVHFASLAELVKAKPTLLVFEGEFLRDAMACERVSEREVYAAIRAKGIRDVADVLAVTLETDATMSVLPHKAGKGSFAPAFDDVSGWPH
ncbi:MAG: DUF421 domain-containing protein [Congregibacter sp.]